MLVKRPLIIQVKEIWKTWLDRSCLTGRFLAQRVSNAERALMWFHSHVSMANTLSILLILDFWHLVLSDGIVISSHQSNKYNADLDVYEETWCIIEVVTLRDVAEVLKVWYSNWSYSTVTWALTVKLNSGESHKTSLMRYQNWFR